MHRARLDPLAARLLAIRIKNGNLATQTPCCSEPEPLAEPEPAAEPPVVPTAVAMEEEDDDVVADAPAELADHALASTDCHTCGTHVGEGEPSMADVVAELQKINARLKKLEDRTFGPSNPDEPLPLYPL
jgi:hypothetical protein